MQRSGNQIQLTPKEWRTVEAFCEMADLPAPDTVQELEKILLKVKALYEEEKVLDGNSKAKILTMMADDFYKQLIELPDTPAT